MLKAILILPFNVLVIIPAILLYFDQFNIVAWHSWWMLLIVPLAIVGGYLMIHTTLLFKQVGHGSPAPWDPINQLIIIGPYRYVRNPMISGVVFTLFAIGLFFQSIWVLIWGIIFLVVNLLYLPFVEEKNLIARYGQAYIDYKNQVPRFIPKFIVKR